MHLRSWIGLKRRSKLTKIYYKNDLRKNDHFYVLECTNKQNVITECIIKILEAKKNYILKITTKLEDTAPKTYWAILNRLLFNKRIPPIPPLLVDGSFFSDYCEKANLFNNLFATTCTPIKNNNVLPPLSYKTNNRISSFLFEVRIYYQ